MLQRPLLECNRYGVYECGRFAYFSKKARRCFSTFENILEKIFLIYNFFLLFVLFEKILTEQKMTDISHDIVKACKYLEDNQIVHRLTNIFL